MIPVCHSINAKGGTLARITPSQVDEFKQRYARWFYLTGELDEEWTTYIESLGDLDWSAWGDMDDFIDGIKTLRTFGPNPRSFNPIIRQEDLT